jgi:zinc transport system substrate-binding protein
MKRNQLIGLIAFFAIIVLGVGAFAATNLTSSSDENKESMNDPEKLNVVTTFYPLTNLAREIGGDAATVQQLNTGGDIHDFEPTLDQLTEISEADILIYNGLELEPWVEDLESTIDSDVVFVNASENIAESEIREGKHDHGDEHEAEHDHSHSEEKHSDEEHMGEDMHSDEEGHSEGEKHSEDEEHSHEEGEDHDHGDEEKHSDEDGHSHDDHEHGEEDPHVWLDPVLYLNQADTVSQAFIDADGDNQDVYTDNAAQLTTELNNLNLEYRNGLQGCSQDTVVISHNVLSYLLARYGFESRSLAGIEPTQELGAQEITEIVDFINDQNVDTILSEAGVSEDQVAAILEETDGVSSEVFYSLEQVDDADRSYVEYMQMNLEALQKALQC